MENEKTIKSEHQQEVVRIFRKLIASGAINKDAAITKILRDFPHYFHQPTPDDIEKISRSELNSEIRRRAGAGVQSNKLPIDFFANVPPTDKKPS
jgi:F420-0:gamma-glutamyl ligase-like protein